MFVHHCFKCPVANHRSFFCPRPLCFPSACSLVSFWCWIKRGFKTSPLKQYPNPKLIYQTTKLFSGQTTWLWNIYDSQLKVSSDLIGAGSKRDLSLENGLTCCGVRHSSEFSFPVWRRLTKTRTTKCFCLLVSGEMCTKYLLFSINCLTIEI